MTSICFYFEVHQPFRLKRYSFFDIGTEHFYLDDENNKKILDKVAGKCYLPANRKMLELIKRFNGKFRISYSLSGVFIEQCEKFRPDVLESFKDLAKTGCVEFISETYYHSLSFLYSKEEFDRQVEMHRQKIKQHFNQEPTVFRNTELIYNNELASYIEKKGYKGILCEGVDRLLGYRNANFVYRPKNKSRIKALLKNYRLSDDIAFRFSDRNWNEFPLTADKFARWAHNNAGNADVINLFMDYETFGEHQWENTGIFEFLDYMPGEILKHPDFNFKTTSEVCDTVEAKGEYDAHDFISWADSERDLSAWRANSMQEEALNRVFSLEKQVKETGDPELLNIWAKLTTSDHFYYMSTKYWADGDVHKYFSPYDSPYDAYIYFMNVISDLEQTLAKTAKPQGIKATSKKETVKK